MKRLVAAIIGIVALREAVATEFGQVIGLVSRAVQDACATNPAMSGYCCDVDSIYPDRVIVCSRGRYYAYPYTIGDDNTVTLGAPTEVVPEYAPVGARVAEAAANGSGAFIEAVAAADASAPPRYLVRVIKSGTSLNGVTYSAAVLREAVPLFNNVRVFAKNDDEHVKGDPKAKDFTKLVGVLSDAKFVESANGGGEIQAVLDVLQSSDVADKLREAVTRGMTGLFGLSIDADGKAKRSGKLREATALTKVNSVDLIIEPGAGGQVIRFTEAKPATSQENTMLRQQMLKFIEARDANRAKALADASDEEVITAYREAVAADAGQGTSDAPAGVTAAELDARLRMIEARANARVAIAESKLPAPAKDRLTQRFAEAVSFTDADVAAAIKAEGEYIGKFTEGAQVRGLGDSRIEVGKDFADKMTERFDNFFNREKPATSFREAYIDFTGDRGVTGLLANCDAQRMREAVGEQNFREAISAATFSNALGDSITRAMVREYNGSEDWADWPWLCDVVPVSDFRQQKRIRLGGYGNLPGVAENGPYNALSSPGDEQATYSPTKRGGTETISLETIANDDVGVIRRVPQKLGVAAARTLYEFVYDFLRTNAAIYDTVALAHATHNNLGTAALDATGFAAARLAMKAQTELTSGKKLGLILKHLVVPAALEEAVFNMFVRGTNLDETFVQSRKPTCHVVDYWTDANDWWATADKSATPLIELGFYGGRQDPELFVQDLPTQGSLFSNDQIKYKIRHIYGGAVIDYRGFYGAVVA